MIGILYLVLLGLVALNVPDSLLDAFKTFSDSLDYSRSNVSTGIQNTFEAFEKTKLKEQPDRARPIYERAKKASAIALELNTYVDQLRLKLIKEGGGIDTAIGDVKGRDDLDISPRVMITEKNADVLRAKIDETREKLLGFMDPKDRELAKFSLNAADPLRSRDVKKTWQEANFGDGIPLGAALASLAKIQADLKNAESEVVKKILGEIDQSVVNLDKFSAVAVAPTSYLILGQPYTAEIFLTAYDSHLTPSISVNGSPVSVREGKGMYTVNTSREGIFTWKGTVRVRQNDGSIKEYTTPDQKYQVALPSAVVSPDKMRVLYAGVPNPLSVSAPGISRENLKVTMSNGSISGSNASYSAEVTQIGATARVTVSATVDGKLRELGSTDFKIKRIPDPVLRFAGKPGGTLSAVALKAQTNLFAVLDNFDFDAKFAVTRFTITIQRPRTDPYSETTSGGALTPRMIAELKKITPGSFVAFSNVIGVGPDKSQRDLGGIFFNAN
jgi:gliding motility-associated protein GldM